MIRLLKIVLGAGVLVVAGCQALGITCTEMGCIGGMEIDLEGAISDGLWEVDITKDGVSDGCTLTWPGEILCDDFVTATASEAGIVVDWRTSMGEAGDSVTVVLKKDGVEVLNETITPEWSDPWYPNGEACDNGNGCQSAQITLTF